MLRVIPDFCPVSPEQATLLGSPIGGEEGVDKPISEITRALEIMGGRLWHIHAHDAFCLLRHAFALPKVLYILRTAPCFQSFLLKNFDTFLRTLLEEIANISIDNLAWVQASLPVYSEGLGVRSTTQLAPYAFLASAAGCAGIISRILLPRLTDAPYQARDYALKAWSEGLEEPLPTPLASSHQRAWDLFKVTATYI